MIRFLRILVDDKLAKDIERSDVSAETQFFDVVYYEDHNAFVVHEPGIKLVREFDDVLLRIIPAEDLNRRVQYEVVVNMAFNVKESIQSDLVEEPNTPGTAYLQSPSVGNGNLAIVVYHLTPEEVLALKLTLQNPQT